MPKHADVGQLAQASYWLAQTLAHVVQLHAGLAAMAPEARSRADNVNAARVADAEDRLALAIEGFGEVIRNGGSSRVERIASELEVVGTVCRRLRARPAYRDLVRWREDGRLRRRKLQRLRQQFERMTTVGVPARDRRRLRAEIRTLEEVIG